MTLFLNMPMKSEAFSVVSRKLTDEEVGKLVYEVSHEARVYFDTAENNGGPRNWPSYEAFLGFKIANVALVYQLDATQLQELVKGVYEREAEEIRKDHAHRNAVQASDIQFPADHLRTKRREQLERWYASSSLNGFQVVDGNGWEDFGADEMRKVIFVEPPEVDALVGPSVKKTIVATFAPGSLFINALELDGEKLTD